MDWIPLYQSSRLLNDLKVEIGRLEELLPRSKEDELLESCEEDLDPAMDQAVKKYNRLRKAMHTYDTMTILLRAKRHILDSMKNDTREATIIRQYVVGTLQRKANQDPFLENLAKGVFHHGDRQVLDLKKRRFGRISRSIMDTADVLLRVGRLLPGPGWEFATEVLSPGYLEQSLDFLDLEEK